MVSPAAEELIQLCALAIRSRVPASLVETQISVYPSRTDHLIRAFGPEPGTVPRPMDATAIVESPP